jgi:NTP pyrophosphatase (non-canonical NTP hydrolase)
MTHDDAQRVVDQIERQATERLAGLARVLSDVAAERSRQFDRWGDQSDHADFVWLGILTEEVGESAQAVLHDTFGGKASGTLYAELVQVAAVACAWLEALHDRGARALPSPAMPDALRRATWDLADAALAHHGDEQLALDAQAAQQRLTELGLGGDRP